VRHKQKGSCQLPATCVTHAPTLYISYIVLSHACVCTVIVLSHACMCVHMCTRVCGVILSNFCTCMSVRAQSKMCLGISFCVQACVCGCACIRACVHVCVSVFTCPLDNQLQGGGPCSKAAQSGPAAEKDVVANGGGASSL